MYQALGGIFHGLGMVYVQHLKNEKKKKKKKKKNETMFVLHCQRLKRSLWREMDIG